MISSLLLYKVINLLTSLFSLGNMYIADEQNQRIRKVTVSTGIITTIAGTGTASLDSLGDGGQATSATMYYPTGVGLDLSGIQYIFLISIMRRSIYRLPCTL